MDPLNRFLLFVALPVVVAASAIEAVVLSRRQGYDWRAAGVSLADLVLRVGVQIFLPLSIATPFIVWAARHPVATIPLDGWAAFAALFIGQEFCYYWFHR